MPNQHTGTKPRAIYIPIGPSIAYVTLTKGKFSVIDVVDIPIVQSHSYYADENDSGKFYARRTAYEKGKTIRSSMHRDIIGLSPFEEGIADHIRNEDTLDNRRANLRNANSIQNVWNKYLGKRNKTGFIGVSWKPSHNAYRCQISQNGKTKFLGYFKEKEVAAQRYLEEARKLHGDFLNHHHCRR